MSDISTQNRMAALLLLSRGQAPSWSETKKARLRNRKSSSSSSSSNTHSAMDRTKPSSPKEKRSDWRIIACLWIISTSFKVLLFPAYRSTDFLVHRHWKAVTRHLPVTQWYFDDRHVDTVHTTDYPPGFMLAECLWANNPVTNHWLSASSDDDCLALMNDAQVEARTTSSSCVALMRTTVIVSELLWWAGAYAVSTAVSNHNHSVNWKLFLLLTFHPALLYLDHVHFQYNGMLLGLLLLSFAGLMRANNRDNQSEKSWVHLYHLGAAGLYALLLSMKHLYVTTSVWFAVYILRRYCLYHEQSRSSSNGSSIGRVSWKRMIALLLCSGLVFVAPFAVFVRALYAEAKDLDEFTASLKAWTRQLLARLFPFGRGLVHDYWAANVWALYTAAMKAIKFAARRLLDSRGSALDYWLETLQYSAVTPTITAVLMLLAQFPGLRLAYRAAEQRSNALLLQSFTYTALATFLFQYHAHEKAILTALIPCTIWAVVIVSDHEATEADGKTSSKKESKRDVDAVWSFLWEFTALSVLGLFPLLYQPQEFLLKLCSYIAYLAALQYLAPATTQDKARSRRQTFFWVVAFATIVQLEFTPLHRVIYGRYEFVPLAITSLVCAMGTLVLFAELMLRTLFLC